MTSIRRMTTLSLALLLILGSLLPAFASEFPPGDNILRGTGPGGVPDSTRIAPVFNVQPTGNWVIHYDPNTPLDEKWEYVNRIGATIVEQIEELEVWVVDVPDGFRHEFHF